jgi:exo-1,4-beta-D-glucosaminidase
MKKQAKVSFSTGLMMILLLLAAASCNQAKKDVSPHLYLTKGWEVQSSAAVDSKGEEISTGNFTPDNWYKTSVPSTVLNVLVNNRVYPDPYFGMNLRTIPGTDYPLNRNFSNREMSETSPFRVPWWYRIEFQLPPGFDGKYVQLHFKGINYRANIWLNGKLLADSSEVAGTFRIYEFDVTDFINRKGKNYMAVEVTAPRKNDLAITWVEWNPAPPDKDMGIWHDVLLTASGAVTVRHPQVETQFDLPSLDVAHLTVRADVKNTSDSPVKGTLKGTIENVSFSVKVDLEANQLKTVTFVPSEYEQLNFRNPRIWWPNHYGEPNLYKLNLTFETGGKASDSQSVNFGIKQVTSELTGKNYLLFKINGKNILIRGGGWASDMMLRSDSVRLEAQIRYVKDMNLNAIRQEGKLENDYFFDLCDENGILVLPGWCCCDQWEQWKEWDKEDYVVAEQSLTDQVKRLRSRASVLTWLYGSDNPPPQDVEKMYLSIFLQNNWPYPHQSSAALKPSGITGYSGIRMEGPYFYTEPSYWLIDTARGGAFGFNAEIGPGASVPVLESILEMFPKDSLWPINDIWHYHGRGGGPARMLDMDSRALNARFGEAKSLEDYVKKSQLQAYEGKRAMFEAYGRNKYTSTGVIQWMLNNAWPGVYWNLYDYFLRTGGSYYGTKKACEPLHIQYSYDDNSVAVVNSYLKEFTGLEASVKVLNFDLTEKYSDEATFDISPDGVKKVLTIPDLKDLSVTYFVKLELKDDQGKMLSTNFYWLSTAKEVFDWGKSYFWATPMISFPDFTALQTLPEINLDVTSKMVDSNTYMINVSNPTQDLALAVNIRLIKGEGGKELIPVLYEDNYFTLLPGESREITATYLGENLKRENPVVRIDGWNVK